jgi:hypothetical protein
MGNWKVKTSHWVPWIAVLAAVGFAKSGWASPCTTQSLVVDHVPVRVVALDLRDPQTILAVGLAGERDLLHPLVPARGDAPFKQFVAQAQAAVMVNGTFFSLAAGRPTVGTLVSAGQLANHVAWRPVGTTLGVDRSNRVSLGLAPQAIWREHWLSLTGGPRLLEGGRYAKQFRAEGIHDPAVLGLATRTAVGVDQPNHTLYFVSIGAPVSLAQEANIMLTLGAWDALNLDGGTSRGLAIGSHIEVNPGRPITNVLLAYDSAHPAPKQLGNAFRAFRRVQVEPPPLRIGDSTLEVGPFAAGRTTAFRTLAQGKTLDFEDWRFEGRGAPKVRNVDGWLDLRSAGKGWVYAAWPQDAQATFKFSCVTFVPPGVKTARLMLGAKRENRFAGALVELPPGRHSLVAHSRAGQLRVSLDGQPFPLLQRGYNGGGVALTGPMMVTRLALEADL